MDARTPPTVATATSATEALAALREVKVKLPVEQVLRLHAARITRGDTVSNIVSTALTRYFQELGGR